MKIEYGFRDGLHYDLLGLTANELGDIMAFLDMYSAATSSPDLEMSARKLYEAISEALDLAKHKDAE